MSSRSSTLRILVPLVLTVVAIPTCGIGGAVLYQHRRGHLGERLGDHCYASSQCAGAPCIHDLSGDYCSKLCDSDGDCPSPYVCEPTRSGRRHACMRAGVDDGSGTGTKRRQR